MGGLSAIASCGSPESGAQYSCVDLDLLEILCHCQFAALRRLYFCARGIDDVYLMRIEQYYPFPAHSLINELERFKGAEIVWCQEEPKNQGAWTFIEPNIEWVLTRIKAKHTRPRYVGRATSASPATGLASQHKAQQEALVNEALSIEGK